MAKKFIQKAIKRKGALRKAAGKKKGEKLSTAEIAALRAKGKRTGNTRLQRQAILAQTLAQLRKRRKK